MRIGFDIALFEGNKWEHVLDKSGKTPWPNKSWELEVIRKGVGNLFSIDLRWTRKTDHAGVYLDLCVLGFEVMFNLSDTRHWDRENNTWEKYDEESVKTRMDREEERKAEELEHAAYLLANANRQVNKMELEEFLETPQGQALLEQKVKAKLAEQRQNKEAKAARGEEYRRANGVGSAGGTQEI